MIANSENIAYYFVYWNYVAFNNELPIPFCGVLHSYRTCGYFQCKYYGGWFSKTFYDFSISITDYYDFTDEQFNNILVHEMIHYYLTYTGVDRRCRHGKEFKKMAKELNKKCHLNITKYLDISKYKKRKGAPSISYWFVKQFYM